jgi:hypothetical protein
VTTYALTDPAPCTCADYDGADTLPCTCCGADHGHPCPTTGGHDPALSWLAFLDRVEAFDDWKKGNK